MKVLRTYTDSRGKKRLRTDEEVIETYLTGYVDIYSGGAIEHLRVELDNLRRGTAELLLAVNREAVLRTACEEEWHG